MAADIPPGYQVRWRLPGQASAGYGPSGRAARPHPHPHPGPAVPLHYLSLADRQNRRDGPVGRFQADLWTSEPVGTRLEPDSEEAAGVSGAGGWTLRVPLSWSTTFDTLRVLFVA